MVVVIACTLLVVPWIAIAWWLRPRAHKDRRHALALAVPAIVPCGAGVGLAAMGDPVSAAPALAAGVLLLLGAWCFWPTSHSRFDEFEREFWAHVARHEEFALRD